MNRGQELLVGLLRVDSSDPALPAAEDWPAVLEAAERHGLKPYLLHRLRSRPSSPAVPDFVEADLRRAYLLNLTVNLRRFHIAAQALRALAAAAVPTIVLKGGYLAETVYGNPALRVMCDIDVLVRREAIPAAAEALASAGFAAEEHRLYPPPPDVNEFHFRHRPSRMLLELHWDLINTEYPFRLDSDSVWSAAVPAKIAGAEALALAPPDLLCHLAVHAGIHSFGLGPKALVDVAETIERLSPDWPALADRARRFRCVRPVWLTLILARRLLGAAVPEAVLEDLRPPGPSEELVAAACERVFRGEETTAPGNAGNPNLVLLFGRKGLWPKIKLGLHRAFPSRAALAALYPVNPKSPRIYLCYFRWINKLIKRNGPAIRARLFRRRSDARASAGGDHAALMDWMIRGE